MMKKCEECGFPMGSSAKQCMRCGQIQSKDHVVGGCIELLIALIILLAIIGSC